MANILTIFLLIATIFTGIFWIFYCIKNIKSYFFKKKNKIIVKEKINFTQSLGSFFPVFLMVFIIRTFIYEPFQIPSGSMMPTLLVGDFILVEKFSYSIKEPITNKILMRINNPKRGDVVVFKHPINYNTDYIKRIIGIPGDKITYNLKSKKISICSNYVKQNICQKKIVINYSQIKKNNLIQKIYFLNKKNLNNKKIYNSLSFDLVQENLDKIKHNILLLNNNRNLQKNYYQQKNMPKLTWIVPKGKYFMMGDNRDNSLDSRYWGFVPEQNLVGKAIKIWMSFNKNENEWPTGIRINRIGSIY